MVIDEASLEAVFVFCFVWGFGSSLTLGDDGHDYLKVRPFPTLALALAPALALALALALIATMINPLSPRAPSRLSIARPR